MSSEQLVFQCFITRDLLCFPPAAHNAAVVVARAQQGSGNSSGSASQPWPELAGIWG